MIRSLTLLSLLALPLAAWFLGATPVVTLTAVVAGLTVVAKHHANIGRLLDGAEPKLGQKR